MIYRLLVSLGAVNMILVLLFGSFAQQSAQQSLRNIAMGSSSINRSTIYQSSRYPGSIGTFINRFQSNYSSSLFFFNYDFRKHILLTSSRWRDEQLREPTELQF